MCGASPSSQRIRRGLGSFAADSNTDQMTEDMTVRLGACALHHEGSLPETATLSGGSVDSSWLAGDDEGSHRGCPVTGRLSNVLDDYVVFPEVLGEGQYGCVRECIHRATWQKFACKSIDKSKIQNLGHLRNEVNLLSELNHRGIMRMVDCYEDADYLHIVSEKYTGGELFDVIVDNTTEDGCLSEREAARIVESLLEAVAYLHESDVIHRDIKPENILFRSRGRKGLKLIDFGLSRRHRDGESYVGDPVGTSYYMPPEVLRGEYNKSCDVWAVGIITYILLCGYPPYNGDTEPEVFEAVRKGDLKFPSKQWHSTSDGVIHFVECLLRMDPRTRITAAEALRHPWMQSLGRERERRQVARRPVAKMPGRRLRYLKIP